MIIMSRVLSVFNAGLGVTRFYSSYKEKTYEAGRSLRSTASAIGQPLHQRIATFPRGSLDYHVTFCQDDLKIL
jgi:hypothetical protein